MRARLAAVATGMVAVGSKELRGRMRGPRSFIALTFYLALIAGFTAMIYLLSAQSAANAVAFGGGNPYVSSTVGQAVFTTLLFLQVLLVVFLAPAATSGAISLEREKQTLDLLTATPISTLAIVLGKLVSALAFVLMLILASVPLTAVVFVFGGVAPEDILRGYLVLFVTAVGFGSVGILLSAVTRRTQSATVLTYLVVLALTVGTGFTWYFWNQMAGSQASTTTVGVRDGVIVAPAGGGPVTDVLPAPTPTPTPTLSRPPEALLWLNPVVAAADVVCGTDVDPYSTTCQLIATVTGRTPGTNTSVPVPMPVPMPVPGKPGVGWNGGVVQPGVAILPVAVVGAGALTTSDTSTSTRDSFWPQASLAWLATSALLVLAAVQLVSPTRRWRRPRLRRRREPAP